jgi:hypothetical protein
MAPKIIHQPRVAWELARVAVDAAAAGDDQYVWFATRVADLLGAAYRRELFDTRTRLAQRPGADPRQVETGVWRVRLEDVLRSRPELAEDLQILALDARTRLAAAPS